jgi:hypothetical protein
VDGKIPLAQRIQRDLESLRVTIRDDQFRPFGEELPSKFVADASTCSGHEDAFASEARHAAIPSGKNMKAARVISISVSEQRRD